MSSVFDGAGGGSMPDLGRITAVPPREVWPDEARDFTPWLLRNVDVLNGLLGMDLVLESAEHAVGDFSADLVGRDLADGGAVVVENQLGASDHDHLGKLLTYAGGTGAKTVVWVATRFRAEHAAALAWLNEHTDPDTRFFGVVVKVARIGDSVPAPDFELAVAPNDWVKASRAVAAAASVRGDQFAEFWQEFAAAMADEQPGWVPRGRIRPVQYLTVTTNMAARVATGATRTLSYQLTYGGGTRDRLRFEALAARRADFEALLGEGPVEWVMPAVGRPHVEASMPFDIDDRDQWPDAIKWLIGQYPRWQRAIEAIGDLALT
jgi:hypothetical protein